MQGVGRKGVSGRCIVRSMRSSAKRDLSTLIQSLFLLFVVFCFFFFCIFFEKLQLFYIQCNEAESASPRPENKYSGVPEAYSGLVTFKYASGTPEYIYSSYQHFGHEQKSISPQILWFSIQR